MKHFILATLCFLSIPAFAQAQDVQEQAKVAWHTTASINNRLFVAGWAIDFAKNGAPDSLNLIGGLGVKGKTWSLENMVWRQVSAAGNQWGLDFRFVRTYQSGSLYMEIAPYLTKAGVYHAIIAERRLRSRMNIGVEVENTYQPGKDSLGGGPRLSAVVAKGAHYKLVSAYSYQIRRGLDASRFYLILHTNR